MNDHIQCKMQIDLYTVKTLCPGDTTCPYCDKSVHIVTKYVVSREHYCFYSVIAI